MDSIERKIACDLYSSWAQGTFLYVKWAVLHNVNYYELLVFYTLITNGTLTQKAIGHYLGLPKQTINNVIRTLKKDGYITLETCENDKREKTVCVTDAGKEYSDKMLAPLYRIEERVCKNIGNERILEMIETSELFNVLFEKEMEKEH